MTTNPARVVISRMIYLWVAVISVWPQSNHDAVALEPLTGRAEFERRDVPANLPAAWPKEIDRLIPVPREEFESLIEQLNARNRAPRSAWLKSAHYEATLVKDSLRGGLMTASVQRLAGGSALLELGDFSLALEDLKWQDRAAVWGSSADGRVWLVADGVNDELLGEWSCRGRTFPGGIDFDLRLPLATTSFLDLRVPRGFLVNAPSAEVTLLSDVPTEETRLWRIQCGSDNHVRITFVLRDDLDTPKRALLVERDMQVVVREEDLGFKLNLFLEAIDAPISDLTLKVPAGVEIYSAVYGADTAIPIRQTPESKADGRISIRLPGPLTGRRRLLHIEGSADQKPGQPAILPNIAVEDSTFDGGHLAVTVQSPLEVRSIRTHGYRQRTTDGGQRTTDVESFTFQQLTADSQLILDVHRAPVSLSGRSFSILDVDDDSWNLTSEIVWNSLTGRAYQTSCLLPPLWEVIDVALVSETENRRITGQANESQRSRESPRLNWDVQSHSGGASILTIEFLEPVQLGQSRAVKVLAQRRLPLPNEPVPIPQPQLINCDVSETILGIQFPISMNPVVSADTQWERIARPNSTVFTVPPDRPNTDQRWYRGDSLENTGTLELKPRLLPVRVKMKTVLEALPAEYRVKYSIQYEHREPLSDRLLVYLTESSPDIRWTWKGMQSLDLSAVQLPKSQHVEWNLPSKGELWEVRLPRTTGQTATIEGLTTNRWSVSNRPALLFIPQAVDKNAELFLSQPEALELNLETNGLRPTGQRLSWLYSTPQAEFGLGLRNPKPSNEFPLMVSMQLRTLMSADSDGFDVYRVRLQLENGSAQESLRIKLDSGAILQETFVGGESIVVTLQGGEFVIPGLNAARREPRDIVELHYRVPAHARTFHEHRRIVVPHVSAQVLGFFWEFSIPPSARIFSEPTGVHLTRSLPSPSWNERLFGPLGRTRTEPIFHPLRYDSWVQLVQPRQRHSTFGSSDGELLALQQAIAPTVPEELSIELWHAARIQLLTWISFGFCLSLGILLRMIRWTYRDRVAAYWLALSVSAAFSASAPYVDFLGGAITGSLIALLVPHHLLRRVNRAEEMAITSNPSFRPTLIAFLLGGLTMIGLTSLPDARSFAQEESIEAVNDTKRPIVFVPIDEDGQPSATLQLVYVPGDAFAKWKNLVSDRAVKPTYLISSARYSVSSMPDGNFNLTAKYRVHVLDPMNSPVRIALPLSDVSLPDAESCRVNGIPNLISALPNGKGYEIELNRQPQKDSEVARQNLDLRHDDSEVGTFDIELRARKPRPQTANLDLRIPSVANSRLEFLFPETASYVEIIGGRGMTDRASENRFLVGDLGSSSSIQVRWGQSVPPLKPVQVAASLLQHVELRSAFSELYFHLAATVNAGSLNSLEFELPQNAIVRRIQSRADDLLRTDVVVAKDGQRRLRLIFEKPPQSPVVIDGTLVLLQADSLARIPLPKFGLLSSETVKIHYDRNWWGVSTSADFRLETSDLDPENVNTISSDAYLNAWVEAADSRHPEFVIPRQPQFTIELHDRTSPTFNLAPYQTRRRAIQWKQTGFIGKRRLDWTLVGEIETSQVPTFQTVLLVDRRLKIENVSVKENGAERRNRWTESRTEPSRVVLFLSDKTQGKQTITLQGSLPIIPGAQITLPSIRAEDCEMIDSRIVLTYDPEVEVAFEPPAEWKAVATDDANLIASRTQSSVVLGSFQTNESNAHGTIQTSARHSRCSSHAAVLLNRTDGSNWRMRYRLELIPEGESPLRIGLNFPATITDINSVSVERAVPLWHEIKDGFRQLDLLLNRNDGPSKVIVQFEIPMLEPKQSDWELPMPIPLHSMSHETLLAFGTEQSTWFPNGGLEVWVADLPDWSSEFYREIPGIGSAFKLMDPLVELQRDVVTSNLRDPSIRLLDQRIWLDESGRCSGITQAFLSSVRNDLEFELPPAISITSLFLDEDPLALSTPSDGRLAISMSDAGTESILTITWMVEGDNSGFDLSETKQLPWPQGIRVDRNLITVLPESPIRLSWRSAEAGVSSLDQNLDRLETLLDRHSGLGDKPRKAEANRWLIHQLQSRLVARLSSEVEYPSEAVRQRLDRWSQITVAINQLEPVPSTPPINWQNRLLEGTVTEFPMAIRSNVTQMRVIEFWRLNWNLINCACSALLAILLIPVCRGLIRIEWSGWLHQHVAISWFLFATFWWLFLTPSAIGPILMAFGLVRSIIQSKPANLSAEPPFEN